MRVEWTGQKAANWTHQWCLSRHFAQSVRTGVCSLCQRDKLVPNISVLGLRVYTCRTKWPPMPSSDASEKGEEKGGYNLIKVS